MSKYAINDYIRYSTNGICVIKDIVRKEFPGSCEPAEYYVLSPIGSPSTTLYVPLNNDILTKKMTRVLSKRETDELILSSRMNSLEWPDDRKLRGDCFQSILKKCDQCEMLKLISCIYLKKTALQKIGKSLSASEIASLSPEDITKALMRYLED